VLQHFDIQVYQMAVTETGSRKNDILVYQNTGAARFAPVCGQKLAAISLKKPVVFGHLYPGMKTCMLPDK
jgi:hypothetical protein